MSIETDSHHDSKFKIIGLTPENIEEYGVCGYKDAKKHLELRRKIDWFCKYYPLGLRIKAVIADTGEYQGMLEFIPHSNLPALSGPFALLATAKSSAIIRSAIPGLRISLEMSMSQKFELPLVFSRWFTKPK